MDKARALNVGLSVAGVALVACVVAMFALGCSAQSAENVVARSDGEVWHVATIENMDATASDQDKALGESTLAAFLVDAKLTLNSDGTVGYTYLGSDVSGTWSADGSRIDVSFPEDLGDMLVAGSYEEHASKLVANIDSGRAAGYQITFIEGEPDASSPIDCIHVEAESDVIDAAMVETDGETEDGGAAEAASEEATE